MKIAPSVLSADFMDLASFFPVLERGGVEILHLDIMDGRFVPNMTFGPPIVSSMRKRWAKTLEAHLMIESAQDNLDSWISCGCDRILLHPESTVHLHRHLQKIRAAGLQSGVVLNPSTPLSCLEYILEEIDMVLLMTVNPGFGGQSYIEAMNKKILDCRKILDQSSRKILLEIDGGVNLSNLLSFSRMGVDVVVVGSALFNDQDLAKNLEKFRELL